MPVNTLIENVN